MSTPRTQTREQYRQQMTELATKAFADHVLREEIAGRQWEARRADGSGFYAFRVVLAPFLIVIYGDIRTWTFMVGDRDPLAWLRMVAGNDSIDPDYIMSKCTHDTGRREPLKGRQSDLHPQAFYAAWALRRFVQLLEAPTSASASTTAP